MNNTIAIKKPAMLPHTIPTVELRSVITKDPGDDLHGETDPVHAAGKSVTDLQN
jgi:hypothetical protein